VFLNTEGQLYHIGFQSSDISSSSKIGTEKNGLGVEEMRMQRGPAPHLNKKVVLSADGKVEEKEPEKSFLQKYVSHEGRRMG
jgi:hypothetical protein